MPLLSAFLDDRSGKIGQMAVDNILLASATRALAAATAATGKQIGDLSATEVAEGIVRLAASEALAERSSQLAAESGDSAATGYDELVTAGVLHEAAGKARGESFDAGARGAAALGAATAEAALAESLVDEAQQSSDEAGPGTPRFWRIDPPPIPPAAYCQRNLGGTVRYARWHRIMMSSVLSMPTDLGRILA